MSSSRIAAVGLACLVAPGCGAGLSAPRTVPTSGTVLFRGKPAGGVKVTFHPGFDMIFRPNGTTGPDGRFILSTAAPADGAPPGEYAVTFELMRAGSDARGLDIESDAWKGRHANPAAAPKVTVGPSATALEPFRLD